MNYAVEQRVRMIEFLLVHYNSIGREQLVDYFGISEPQASRDFRLYKELAPDNMILNESSKRYVKLDTFKRIY